MLCRFVRCCTNPALSEKFRQLLWYNACTLRRQFSLTVARASTYSSDNLLTLTPPSELPEYFNFAQDVIDFWALEEKKNGTTTPAFWYLTTKETEIKYSFQDLSELSKRASGVLKDVCGLSKGNRILIILPKIPEYWVISLAALRSGIISTSGTVMLREQDIQYRIQTYKPACVFVVDEKSEEVDKVCEACPSVKFKILVAPKGKTRKGWLNFNDLMDKASPFEGEKTKTDETSIIFYTSGTTGPAKMVEHTNSYAFGHIDCARYLYSLQPGDVFWCIADTGWAKTSYGCLFAPWIAGACVFIHQMPRFGACQTLQTLCKYPVTGLCGPPTSYRMMIHQDKKLFKFLSLKECVSAGEPLNSEVVLKWQELTGLWIREGYGQTETTVLCCTTPRMKLKPGSMGKPLPTIDMKILDENGNETPPETVGLIAIDLRSKRYPGLFKQYTNDAEKTKEAFGDFYYTGDKAYRDEDGYFWFVSRSDDVIKSSGYRIGPYEVESALIKHPAVVESAVVGSPDYERGEVVKAFVILHSEYKNKNPADLTLELQNFVKDITAPYKYPRKIEFVDELPKTISGKILRRLLRDKEIQSVSKK